MIKYCATKNCLNEIKRKGAKYCKKCESRHFRSKNVLKYVYDTAKHNAKRRGIKFSISIEYFEQLCIETNYLELRGPNGEDMTLDRKIPRLGYVEGNIQVITRVANAKKQHKEKGWDVEPVDRTGVPF